MIDFDRYKRHLLLPDIGESGQRKLSGAKVLVVGAGGLGSPVCMYLAAAGVGEITVVDFDTVDISNLQRQILYTTADVGRRKVDVACERMAAINPDIKVNAVSERFDAANAERLSENIDIIVEASDNIDTKYFCNDFCVKSAIPLVLASIGEFTGNVMTILPGGADLRTVFPDAVMIKESADSGVIGAVPGIAGSIQAAEVVKFITGTGNLLTDKLLTFNARTMEFLVIDIN